MEVKMLEKASNSDGLADGHLEVLKKINLLVTNWRAVMVDRAATNGAAITKVNTFEDVNVLRAACIPHTLSHVGEKFKAPALDNLMKQVRKSVSHAVSRHDRHFYHWYWAALSHDGAVGTGQRAASLQRGVPPHPADRRWHSLVGIVGTTRATP